VPADYHVYLDAFHGPMDLLLYLIRKHEVDIHDIPVATIAEQYAAHLEGIDRLDIESAGEFLVMAATLMEIKSRMIAARTEGREPQQEAAGAAEPEVDPRRELVEQLLEYKKYRDAADALERRREAWSRRFAVQPVGVSAEELRTAFEAMDDEVDLDDVSLGDVIAAFEKIAASVNMESLGDHAVVQDDTPIELHAEDIADRVRSSRGQLTLWDVLEGRTRAEMVGLLLAMLDLVRQERLTFRQCQDASGVGESIVLEWRDPPAEGDGEGDPGPQK